MDERNQISQSEVQRQPEPKRLNYHGKTYIQRDELQTYLFMGIDEIGAATGTQSYIGGGQVDFQLLLVLDHANKTWQILQLNRDSMVEVPVLGVTGEIIGTEFEQLTLAHSYGNGLEESCENTVLTVSNLFNGQTIDGYMSLNMDAIAIITDMADGVPVTVTSDFTAVDPSLKEGETIILRGEQALTFVRTRKDVEDQSNLSRMERQRQFLSALQKRVADKDAEFVIMVYDAIVDYMVSDIGSKSAADIAQYMKEYKELPILTIDGQTKIENDHVAYYLDEDSLTETMIELFYEVYQGENNG